MTSEPDSQPDLPTTDPTTLPIFDRGAGTDGGGHAGNRWVAAAASTAPPASRRAPAARRLAGPIDARTSEHPTTPTSLPGATRARADDVVVDLRDRPEARIRRPAPAVPPASPATLNRRPPAPRDGEIDWQFVATIRSQASSQLTQALGDERGQDAETEQEIGRTIIQELLQSEAAERLSHGEPTWSLQEQDQLALAVFDALFRHGRLQPYIDDPTVENVIIAGSQNVWLDMTDGSRVRVAPVAESDQELIDFLTFIASRSEGNARPFSPANPSLHMRLDGGHRLAAAAFTTARPSVVIRRHGLRQVSLDDLVDRNTITLVQASFLRAAVRAGKSIVVAGPQGAGKTTTVRALCEAIPKGQSIGTFETEFELHLHELSDVHDVVVAWEARPGSGETVTPDGRQAGEFTLDQALTDSFRFNLQRQIVGEVRGKEVWAMIKAMESGTGSISTTHAANAEATIRKLVTCAMEAGSHVTRELATSKLAETVDIVVQLHLESVQIDDDEWRRSRWVSEILAISPGEVAKGYATTAVFTPNPDGGPAIAGVLPDDLRSLEAYGFDLNGYLAESGSLQETQ